VDHFEFFSPSKRVVNDWLIGGNDVVTDTAGSVQIVPIYVHS